MSNSNFWTTLDGEKIPYEELTDNHLKNIIKDGYRNAFIIAEAKRRKFKIPKRPIDSLALEEFFMLIEGIHSAALSGNKAAIKMANLYETDKTAFCIYLNKILSGDQ